MKTACQTFAQGQMFGKGGAESEKPFMKYEALSAELFKFFIHVRDAHGAVSRSLLESFTFNLGEKVQKRLLRW